jgi:hypothetical protein
MLDFADIGLEFFSETLVLEARQRRLKAFGIFSMTSSL